jgi:enoyl-[acyl-carrier protein] reductase I
VHSIGFAPEAALGGNFLNTSWEDVATAVQISAYSLKSLTMACKPVFKESASVVGLDFDAQVAWPKYDWMGVAKAALESTSRYLARDLGKENIRINVWNTRSPLHWDVTDPVPAAKAAVALLSDWFPKTTAEIIHVDGGLHGMGA